MAKSSSFRFAIADTVPRSECWSLFTSGNDVYLTGSAYKKTLKISLHQSGVCQIALLEDFFTEHVEGKTGAPEHRDILRWKRLPTPKKRGQVAASILFASCELWAEQEPIPSSKPFTKIEPPPDMYCRIVNVVYSQDDPRLCEKLGKWTDKLIFSLQLPNGEFLCLMQELVPLDDVFFDFTPTSSKAYVTLGIEEAELDDVRGISVFDCAQLFEGHGCVRSLHNMRIITVDAP